MKRTFSWLLIFAEGAVIVVSVLVALTADAWWDARRNRAEEAARLSAVREELLEARTSYVDLLEVIEGRTALASEVLDQSNELSASAARLDSIFFQLGPFADPSPPTNAYSDAVSGGALALIRSPEVRRALGRYGTAVEAVRSEAEALRVRFEDERSLVYQHINLQRQMATSEAVAFQLDVPEVPFRPLYQDLFANREFINGMVGQIALMARMRIRTEEALSVIDDLLALLNSLGYGHRD